MPTTLTTHAQEKSTFVITAAFTDEADDALTPKTLTWTLTDSDGTVINSKQDEVISSPSSSEDIVLSEDDLQILSATDDGVRKLTIEGTYDSSYGNDLPLRDSVTFIVDNLVAVT